MLREAMSNSPLESRVSQVTWVYGGAQRRFYAAGVDLE